MAISKSSLLSDSKRYFMLSVSRYHDSRPEGRLSHDSLDSGMAYCGWVDLVYKINMILDTLRCPISNMEQRSFKAVPNSEDDGKHEEFSDTQRRESIRMDRDITWKEGDGPAGFRIFIRYRYNASWQGQITSIGTGRAYDFASFLELVMLLDYDLTGRHAELIEQPGSQIYRLASGQYLKRFPKGSVHCVALQENQPFFNVFDLIQKVESPVHPKKQDNLIRGGLPDRFGLNGGGTTFVIRLLFREHATWQGVICWREAGQKVNFRSFLEMLVLMDRAITGFKDKFCSGLDQENQEEDLQVII